MNFEKRKLKNQNLPVDTLPWLSDPTTNKFSNLIFISIFLKCQNQPDCLQTFVEN